VIRNEWLKPEVGNPCSPLRFQVWIPLVSETCRTPLWPNERT
jgi:hypothetical protein